MIVYDLLVYSFILDFIIKITIDHLQANNYKKHHWAGPPGVHGDEVSGGA